MDSISWDAWGILLIDYLEKENNQQLLLYHFGLAAINKKWPRTQRKKNSVPLW